MKKRDKQLACALKEAFPAQHTKEYLHNRILEHLPERECYTPDKILTLLNFAAIAVCVIALFTFDWSDVAKNIMHITTCYLKDEYYEINLNFLLIPLLVITIIWLLQNTIEEHRKRQNYDMWERAVKQRRHREVTP